MKNIKRYYNYSRILKANIKTVSLFTYAVLLASLTILGSCSNDDKAIPPNVSITVTFDIDGGSAIAPITVTSGVKITAPPAPTKAGYIFKEWQLNGTVYDFNVAARVSITLKAKWELNGSSTDWTIDTDAEGNATIRQYNKPATGEIVIPAFVDSKKVIRIKGENDSSAGIFNQTSFTLNSTITIIDFSNSTYVTSIEDYALSSLTGITSITLPTNLTSIENTGLAYLENITSLTLPNSLTNIGKVAFAGCTSLTIITIPNNVTLIGYEAFTGCTSVTSITIPASVASIADLAFTNCSALTSVTIKRVSPLTTLGIYVFDETPIENTSKPSTIFYPTGADYKEATNWSAYATTTTWTAQD